MENFSYNSSFSVHRLKQYIKNVPLSLKHFHIFFKSANFFQLVLKYGTQIFKKVLNSNFTHVISEMLKHGSSKEFPFFVLTCEELHKLNFII